VWLLPAAVVLALIRVLVRWVTVAIRSRSSRSCLAIAAVRASAGICPFRHPPGRTAVALAAGFDLIRGTPGPMLVTILLSVMAAEALAAVPC